MKPQINFQVPRGPSKTFGRSLWWDPPEDANVAILCHNDGYGLVPFRLSLPHQFYGKDFAKYAEELPRRGGNRVKSFTIIPARASEYVEVAKVVWK